MTHQKVVVSGVLLNKENEIFLARRSLEKKFAPGIYHLPGGHVEFGEQPTETLKREFKEEFDLMIEVRDIVRAFSYIRNEIHYIEISYLVSSEDDLENISFDKSETEEIVWAKSDQLDVFLPVDDHDYITLYQCLDYYGA